MLLPRLAMQHSSSSRSRMACNQLASLQQQQWQDHRQSSLLAVALVPAGMVVVAVVAAAVVGGAAVAAPLCLFNRLDHLLLLAVAAVAFLRCAFCVSRAAMGCVV
jgi:hypothetical protein